MNLSLTAHKAIWADSKNTPPLQQLRVGTTGVNEALEAVLHHPLREPLQLAVTQEAGGVQVPEERNHIQFASYEMQISSTSPSNLSKYSPSEEFGNSMHNIVNIPQSASECKTTSERVLWTPLLLLSYGGRSADTSKFLTNAIFRYHTIYGPTDVSCKFKTESKRNSSRNQGDK